MLSPTSQGRMWDAKKDRYARSEGVISIVLQRLGDATSDNDSIECVIRATGTYQGRRTTELAMPSGAPQLGLTERTFARGGMDPLLAIPRKPPLYLVLFPDPVHRIQGAEMATFLAGIEATTIYSSSDLGVEGAFNPSKRTHHRERVVREIEPCVRAIFTSPPSDDSSGIVAFLAPCGSVASVGQFI
ncbi:uncharacterized protein BDV17DRAFT_291422 [Aspergillus undulatus]|uniref:uncharacterized protein n=1 Tax=Aspergillus undulatus TaxID=1810928 RepID=UPI003CCD2D78